MSSNMQYKGNNFCTEPYRTVCIGTTGGVSPCCALSHKSFGLVTEDSANSINEVYDSKYWKRFFKNNAAGYFDDDCLFRMPVPCSSQNLHENVLHNTDSEEEEEGEINESSEEESYDGPLQP